MTNGEIRFQKGKETYVFEYGKKRKLDGNTLKNLYKNEMRELKPIFDAITSIDGEKSKLDSAKEVELLKKLHLLIASDGEISDVDLLIGEEFKRLKKQNKEISIEAFLDKKLADAGLTLNAESQDQSAPVPTPAVVTPTPVVEEQTPQDSSVEQNNAPKDVTQTQAQKRQAMDKAYMEAIQNKVVSMVNQKDFLKAEFTSTYKVQSGDNLIEIAIAALKDENDGKMPTQKEIHQRVAEIALVNGISNVNKIYVGKELQVGKAKQQETPAGTPTEPPVETPVETPAVSSQTEETTLRPSKIKVSHESLSDEVIAKLAELTLEEAPADETEEVAKARKAKNLENLKQQIEISNSNFTILIDCAIAISDPSLIDRTSPEVKELVNELLLTKDISVIESLLKDGLSLFQKDETSFRTVAALFKEIRDKEKAGQKTLTEDEFFIKETLQEFVIAEGYVSDIDKDKDCNSDLRLNYDGDGNVCYIGEGGELPTGFAIASNDRVTVEKFTADLRAAESMTGKIDKTIAMQDLYKKYAGTRDNNAFACSVLANPGMFGADKEDVLTAIKYNGVEFLTYLDTSYVKKDLELKKAVIERITELLVTEAPNPDNIRFLEFIFDRINDYVLEDNADDETKNDKALKRLILEQYFTTEKDADGNITKATYSARKLTKEDAYGLARAVKDLDDNVFKKALVDMINIDNMHSNEFGHTLQAIGGELVEKKLKEIFETQVNSDNVFRFIYGVYYSKNIPNDKILEEYSSLASLPLHLLQRLSEDSKITDANRVNLINIFIDKETGLISESTMAGPPSVTWENILTALPKPENCKEGEAKKVLDAVINSLGKDEINKALYTLYCKGYDGVKERVENLLKENSSDVEFIKKVGKIQFFRAQVAKVIDLSTFDEDTQKELKESFFSNISKANDGSFEMDLEMYNQLKYHNWIETYDFKSSGAKAHETIQWLVNTDAENSYRIDENANPLKFIPCNPDGIKKGVELFAAVHGVETGNRAVNEGKLLDTPNYVTPDNVIDIIEEFARQVSNISASENILEWMDNEFGGASRDQMNKIPEALLKAAEKHGIDIVSKDSVGAKLRALMNKDAGWGGDYASGVAKQIDDLMIKLIAEIRAKMNE